MAVHLNGSSQYLRSTAAQVQGPNLGDMTLQGWVKFRRYGIAGAQQVCGWGNSANSNHSFGCRIYANGTNGATATGQCGLAIRNSGSFFHVQVLDVNDMGWHHIALVQSGSSRRCYVDGVDSGSPENSGTWSMTSLAFGLQFRSAADTSLYCRCWLTDWTLHTRAFSEAEIQSLHASPARGGAWAMHTGDRRAYWPFQADAADDSGSGYDLTETGTPTYADIEELELFSTPPAAVAVTAHAPLVSDDDGAPVGAYCRQISLPEGKRFTVGVVVHSDHRSTAVAPTDTNKHAVVKIDGEPVAMFRLSDSGLANLGSAPYYFEVGLAFPPLPAGDHVIRIYAGGDDDASKPVFAGLIIRAGDDESGIVQQQGHGIHSTTTHYDTQWGRIGCHIEAYTGHGFASMDGAPVTDGDGDPLLIFRAKTPHGMNDLGSDGWSELWDGMATNLQAGLVTGDAAIFNERYHITMVPVPISTGLVLGYTTHNLHKPFLRYVPSGDFDSIAPEFEIGATGCQTTYCNLFAYADDRVGLLTRGNNGAGSDGLMYFIIDDIATTPTWTVDYVVEGEEYPVHAELRALGADEILCVGWTHRASTWNGFRCAFYSDTHDRWYGPNTAVLSGASKGVSSASTPRFTTTQRDALVSDGTPGLAVTLTLSGGQRYTHACSFDLGAWNEGAPGSGSGRVFAVYGDRSGSTDVNAYGSTAHKWANARGATISSGDFDDAELADPNSYRIHGLISGDRLVLSDRGTRSVTNAQGVATRLYYDMASADAYDVFDLAGQFTGTPSFTHSREITVDGIGTTVLPKLIGGNDASFLMQRAIGGEGNETMRQGSSRIENWVPPVPGAGRRRRGLGRGIGHGLGIR